MMILSIVRISVSIISLIFNYIVYQYLQRLEESQCKCSKSWKRNILKNFTVYNFVFLICSIIYPKIPMSISYIMSIYSFIYFIFIFSYTHKLREKKCQCSKGTDSNIIYYYYMTRFVLYMFFTCILLLIFLSSFIYLIFKST